MEQVQIENSTIHIGEVTVVQPTADEDVEQEVLAEPVDKAAIKQEKSRIPFNVLMLKRIKRSGNIANSLRIQRHLLRMKINIKLKLLL